jgi:hypothetical protein
VAEAESERSEPRVEGMRATVSASARVGKRFQAGGGILLESRAIVGIGRAKRRD